MLSNVYNRFVIYVFAGFFIMLSIIVYLSLYERIKTEEKEKWVDHTSEVIFATESLLSYLKDAETGQRGYLLTRDSSFLQPYVESNDSIWTCLARIAHLTKDNQEQQLVVHKLGGLIWERLSLLEGNLLDNPVGDVSFLANLNLGKAKMDGIRNLIAQILKREHQLLDERIVEFNHSKTLATYLFWVIYTMVFVYFLITSFYFKKLINSQRRYEKELYVKNQELHAFNEEMDALNEELKSSNEELLATNEEYLTANEELNEANEMIRFQSEKLIRQSEEKLNEVLDSINDIVTSSDAQTRQMIFVNKACTKILGITPDMIYADSGLVHSMIYKDDLKQIQADTKLLFEVGEADTEFRMVRPDGKVVWIASRMILKRDEKGNPTFINSISREITQRKMAQQMLVESEKKYRYLFDQNPLPFWVVDLETHGFMDVNEAALRLYGYSREEFLGLAASKLGFEPENPDELEHMVQNKMEDKLQKATFKFTRKDGSNFSAELYSQRCIFNGKEARIVLTFDITQRKQAEKERSLLTDELIKRNNDLEEFTYIISHNLRSPVANILGLVNILNMPSLPEHEIGFALNKLLVAGNNLDGIVKDINQILSQRENDAGQRLMRIDLETEIKALLESIETTIVKGNATIHLDFSKAPEITTIRSCFHNIAINLVTNAIKYQSPKRLLTIHITSRREGDYICVVVKDNGMGMDMNAVKNKLFKLYSRFHLHVEGKGMGLYLVKSQVETLGGKLEVDSSMDVGSSFTIYFPIHGDSQNTQLNWAS